MATIRYLKRHLGIDLLKDKVFRFIDTLKKDVLTEIAFNFVSKRSGGISVLFYDVTTLYFEAEDEDNFRKKGFSKNHRSDVPQILIGLFVDSQGYPFDFDFFEGSAFEGHTFQSAIDGIIGKYAFAVLTVVADAAMLSAKNLNYLESKGINYIVGARLKNLSDKTTTAVFHHNFADKPIMELTIGKQRLIVDHSEERAKKDGKNRERLIKKLETRLRKKQQVIRKSKYLLWKNQTKIAGIDKRRYNFSFRCHQTIP
jgi:transposase